MNQMLGSEAVFDVFEVQKVSLNIVPSALQQVKFCAVLCMRNPPTLSEHTPQLPRLRVVPSPKKIPARLKTTQNHHQNHSKAPESIRNHQNPVKTKKTIYIYI